MKLPLSSKMAIAVPLYAVLLLLAIITLTLDARIVAFYAYAALIYSLALVCNTTYFYQPD